MKNSPTETFKHGIAKLMLPAVLFTLLFTVISCEAKSDKKFKTEHIELRQLIQKTTNTQNSYASYFLIVGSFSSETQEEVNVNVFAKIDNRYRLIKIPIEDLRIVIDNNLSKPNIVIEYESANKIHNDDLVSQIHLDKIYVIYCPEKYLPEKLLPIGF